MNKNDFSTFLINKIFMYDFMNIYDPHGDFEANEIEISKDGDLHKVKYEDIDGNILQISYDDNNVYIDEYMCDGMSMLDILDYEFNNERLIDLKNLLNALNKYGDIYYRFNNTEINYSKLR